MKCEKCRKRCKVCNSNHVYNNDDCGYCLCLLDKMMRKKERCDCCSGTGFEECLMCTGNGSVYVTNTNDPDLILACVYCKGTGYSKYSCEACGGVGYCEWYD